MKKSAVVAERLRRLTRNQIPSGSVGSNPTNCASFLLFKKSIFVKFFEEISVHLKFHAFISESIILIH